MLKIGDRLPSVTLQEFIDVETEGCTLGPNPVVLDKALAGRQYLMGSQFTVADGYFYNMTRWAKRVNLDLSAFPNVTAVAARIEARPKVQEAVQAEA